MNLRIAVCHLFVFLSLTVHAIEVPDIPENQRVFHMIDAANGLADNSAEVVLTTLSGRMVISSIGHINFYDGTAFSHIGTERENIYTLKKYTGNYRMYFDRHHHLWLKNHGAVSCVDLSTERFVVNVDITGDLPAVVSIVRNDLRKVVINRIKSKPLFIAPFCGICKGFPGAACPENKLVACRFLLQQVINEHCIGLPQLRPVTVAERSVKINSDDLIIKIHNHTPEYKRVKNQNIRSVYYILRHANVCFKRTNY